MAWWFVRGLRRGVVTSRYPARPDPSAAVLPTPPMFRPDLLTVAGVDRLIDICPARALSRDGMTLRYDVGRCTACGGCTSMLGDAVRPSGEFELTATKRDQLIKIIPILGGDR